MPDVNDDVEARLRAHLARVSEAPAPTGLETRVLAATGTSPAPWRGTLLVAAAMVAAITMLVLLTTAHQTSNVFSNISSGLGS